MTSRGAAPTDPVCGASVDPENSPHKATHDGVLGALTCKTIVSALLSGAVLLLAVPSADYLGRAERPTAVLQLLLTTPILFWCGASFLRSLAAGLRQVSFDADSLIGLGAGAAYGYGALATLMPRALVSSGGVSRPFFVSAAWIITFVLSAKLLRAKLEHKASSTAREPKESRPRFARLVMGEGEKEIPVGEVRPGHVLSVVPGEKVPADGVIRRGTSSIDEAVLTGKSVLVDKRPGDRVAAGTLNQTGAFQFEVTHVGDETTLARIVRMVQEAQRSKPLVQRLADRVASLLVPAVIAIAAATFFVWLGAEPSLPFAVSNAVSVLIIACPGALALAAPTAIVVATGRGAQMGILFKSAEALERLSAVTGLVLNKAGTLTEGRFKVTDVLSISDHDTRGLMALAASAEKASDHPAGQAIVSHAHGMGAIVHSPSEFEALPGRGVRARVNGVEVLVGNERLLAECGVDGGRLLDGARHLAAEGKSASFVVADGEKQGIIGMSDELKAESVDAVARMKAIGLWPVMLTGESAGVASRIGESVGLDDVLPEVGPQHKASEVQKLQGTGHKVAMVGDGLHDASALARAHVGIGIGPGPFTALETSDVRLLTNSLSSVVDAVLLSRATMRVVRQNLYWAFFYNIVAIPLAAGVLFPLFGVVLSPIVAAAAMAMSSSTVVANALRLRNFEPSS